ncbi:hypothetical protein GCM10009772_14580 [Pseudonocardia alni subsp. carboxydivorans]|uniref:prolyl aminopeptidase n=1 Tax=Pseudonocardia alni subsp. carboxydivorans TaxID=415010 RepID=A0ABU9AC35_PSEA5
MPLHPPIEPYDAGTLTTDDGQTLHWETCGNPDGRPALDLHGGPGSGASAGARRYYDPERYRIVLLDQRGCGRSRPLASDPDPAVREDAAREWCRWEDTHVSLAPGHRPSRRYEDPAFRLVFARLVTHYWWHAAFLPHDALLRGVTRLAGIPGTLVHGRYDVSGPPDIAWDLHRRWPGSELRIIDDAGHGGAGAFTDAVVDALDRAADRPR